ncbi:hypothetical protein CDAR_182971 [Caerostris darwini]|uniref:Uncharacterized protein n=1 Tax=Caerostris darwini TaxID=1538125 RepID=A0AAV4T5U4_9ARAC|nr:hypothetical protein CDAR_182971 [Caerostris darwini]
MNSDEKLEDGCRLERKFRTKRLSDEPIDAEVTKRVQPPRLVKNSRIQKSKMKVKEPKVTLSKKSEKAAPRESLSRSRESIKKRLSPTISQYSGESDYENPECRKLSYFS